ncbi:hypothetical protein [Aliiglaciecola litoralis]|uniref:Outer membrane protein beta-barrel domain-containing protein n=1 Tax=Aliiglaciecola litoralis TaxID=582857 RepID=A0ABP3WYB2_9ALTE
MKRLALIVYVVSLTWSYAASATDDMYGIVSAGYAKSDIDTSAGADGASYKLALGYEFHRQWYAEFGYQQIVNQSHVDMPPLTEAELANTEFGMKADALVASVLGKAASNAGELFYRLGVMNVDVSGQSVSDSPECALGNGSDFSLDSGDIKTLCEFDEGIIAGVVGIGFDFYLGVNLMLRTEVEHIKGQQGFETNAGYVGLRYNF